MAATRTIDDLPGPPRLPLIGNAHRMRSKSLHLTAEEWCERYGTPYRFDIGGRRVVVIGDAETINAVLRERPKRCGGRRGYSRPRARTGAGRGGWR
jgi:hypothetical protein